MITLELDKYNRYKEYSPFGGNVTMAPIVLIWHHHGNFKGFLRDW